jgi:predicted CoA-binding protein
MERTTRETLLRIYQETETIAVVGASTTEGKPGHDIPLYLQSQGFRIIPVNPRGGRILGEPSFASLRDVDVPVDVVDVFRPPEEAETIARDAIAIGPKTLWFQPGTHTDEAVALVSTFRCGVSVSSSIRDGRIPVRQGGEGDEKHERTARGNGA